MRGDGVLFWGENFPDSNVMNKLILATIAIVIR